MSTRRRIVQACLAAIPAAIVAGSPVAALAQAKGEWRIVFGARILQLVGQPRNRDERNEMLVFDCTEGPTT